MTTGLKEAILGPRSHWQKKRAAVLPPREDWNFFSLGRIPTLARARQGSDAGQVARPGASMPGRRGSGLRRRMRISTCQSDMLKQFGSRDNKVGEASMPGRWRGRWLQCQASGAAGRKLLRQAGAAGTKPPNPHSPTGPCYTCYMCYMGLTRQATEHPLSPGPCYTCYMCYMALYSTYTTDFRAYRII